MIVIGTCFGDEGKGLTTSFLCSQTRNPLVVRFNGGHQAGHTVVHNGNRHVFSSFGAGSLQGVPTYWSKYCTFYPVALVNELIQLRPISPRDPLLYVNPLCPVTTPYDIYFNQKDKESLRNGSVGVGFGATIKRHESYYKLYVQDLFHEKVLHEKLKKIRTYYWGSTVNSCWFPPDYEYFLQCCARLKEIIILRSDEVMRHFEPIFEGAQGILLDQDFGFFPNVTRSNTTTKNALKLKRSKEVFYITRTYQTRHGNGFMSNEREKLELKNNEKETNKRGGFQGEFRTSKLDIDLLNYSLQCDNNFSSHLKKNLVVTCNDQLEIDIDELLAKLNTTFEKVYLSKGDSLTDIYKYK